MAWTTDCVPMSAEEAAYRMGINQAACCAPALMRRVCTSQKVCIEDVIQAKATYAIHEALQKPRNWGCGQ